MVIQIIVMLGVLFLVFPNIYSSYRKKIITPLGASFWIIFWIIGLVIIWFPKIIDFIGGIAGVARSIDALVYLGIIYLLFLVLRQKIKINEIEKEITLMNRRMAIKEIKIHRRK